MTHVISILAATLKIDVVMKRSLLFLGLLLWAMAALSQNVGIGELSPGAKLAVRATDAFSRSLLLKTNTNDTTLYVQGFNHYLGGGYTNLSSSALTINNKHFLPFDNSHLTLMAWGEKSGINAAGSLSMLEFRNINGGNSRYSISGYLGGATPHSMSLFYYNQTTGDSKTLLHFTQEGYTGVGTFTPVGRMQINHTATVANPTLNLFDSSSMAGPILQFRNAGSSRNWQLRTYLNNSIPEGDALYFVNNNNIIGAFSQLGYMGLGVEAPQHKLHLYNSLGAQQTYAQFTNPTTGILSNDGLITGINGAGNALIYNQENSRLFFGTNNTMRMSISETGNVGIGVDPGTERLDVVGNIKTSGAVIVTGEVTRPSTGTSNLVPIAYGNITPTGIINSGSGNFTVSKIATGWYAITITGESYQFQIYTTVVTANGGGSPVITTTGSGGGALHVYTFNAAGVAVDNQFCFVVYKQ